MKMNSIYPSNVSKLMLFMTVLVLLSLLAKPALGQNTLRPINDIFEEAMALKSANHQKSYLLWYELKERQYELSSEQRLDLVYLQAYLQMMRGLHQRAIETHSNLTMVKDPNLALRAYSNMMSIDLLRRNYLGATKYLVPIVELLESRDVLKSEFINTALASLSSFYLRLGDYQSAYKYLQQLDMEQLDGRGTCLIQILITRTQIYLDIISSNDQLITDTIEQCHQVNEQVAKHGFINEIAYMYLNKQEFAQTIAFLTPFMEEVTAQKANNNSAEIFAFLSQALLAQGNEQLAYEYAVKGLEFSKNIAKYLPAKVAHETLYQLALKQGNDQLAYQRLQSLMSINNDYVTNQHYKTLALEQARRELNGLINTSSRIDTQAQLEQDIQSIRQKNHVIFSRYVFLERLIHLVLICLVLYQVRAIILGLKESKDVKKRLRYDYVTHAYTRKYFFNRVDELINEYQTRGLPFTFCLCNIDRFHQFNLLHGNDRGDKVLRDIITTLLNICPKNTLIGRLGGDEFAIVLPLKNIYHGSQIIAQCQQQIHTSEYLNNQLGRELSASFGVTDTIISGYNIDALLQDADQMLIKAKASGGNTIAVKKTEKENALATLPHKAFEN
ncbi:GGDEF domain-containing protein [Thalassotalea aquiviva]|uniref:GGDEF domain-containing protein n=1 Tax=Thalassotalea aquiviva TaxID=3242415 RepID=UPI00352B7A48